MYSNKEVEKKIKKLKIFDELLLIFRRDKIIFKQPHDEKHYTLKFLEGILDFHETVEAREEYDEKYPIEGREKYDLKKFCEAMVETWREELPHIRKEIDINDAKYVNVKVLLIPKNEMSRELMEKVTTTKHKEMIVEESKSTDVMKSLIVPMKDLQNYDFKATYLLKEESFLYRINGKYFLIKWDDVLTLTKKIFARARIKTPQESTNHP